MDLGLPQRGVAGILNANPWTYLLWEHDRTAPTVRFIPSIVQFLEYNPFPKGDSIPDRLRAARRRLGLTQAELGHRTGLSEGTIYDLEHARLKATSPAGRSLRRRLLGE